MKRTTTLLAALAAAAWLAAPPAAADTVQRIKLVVDGCSYVWEPGAPRPVRAEGQFQDPELAFALLGLSPGQELGHDELLERLVDARRLLDKTALFNDAQVFALPSRATPGACTVFVTLGTGFSLRFSGGVAYAMVGNDNADGRLLAWRAWLGYNRDGFALGQGLRDFSPRYWQAAVLYRNNALDRGPADDWLHSPECTLGLGAFGYPWFAHLDIDYTLTLNQAAAWRSSLTAVPELGLEKTWSFGFRDADDNVGPVASSLVLGWSVGARIGAFWPENLCSAIPQGRVWARARTGGLTLASQFYAAWSPQPVLDRFGLDFRSTDDLSLRGDYDPDYLLLDRALFSSTELRLEVANFDWGIIHPIAVEPFVFFDALWGGRSGAAGGSGLDRRAQAFGPGLRLLFGSPVDVDFSFTLGMTPFSFAADKAGRSPLRFAMTVTAGF